MYYTGYMAQGYAVDGTTSDAVLAGRPGEARYWVIWAGYGWGADTAYRLRIQPQLTVKQFLFQFV